MRTKKNRQKRVQYKQLSAVDMKASLQEMIQTGIKNATVIDLFRNGLFNEKTASQQRIRPKRVRS